MKRMNKLIATPTALGFAAFLAACGTVSPTEPAFSEGTAGGTDPLIYPVHYAGDHGEMQPLDIVPQNEGTRAGTEDFDVGQTGEPDLNEW
jgi:hypothetical protein